MVELRWGIFWVLIVCPLGGVATSKAPHTLLPWVPKELNKVHRRAYNSSNTAPTYCRPPGRKHSANNETSPAPALTIRPFCFKISQSSPNGAEGEVKRVQVLRVKSEFDVCFWTLRFEIVSSPQEWRCGHLNKAGKKNKWRSAYFHLEEKQEALNTECQQFKELQGRWGGRTHTRTHTCTYTQHVIQFKQTGGLTDPHKATFMVTEATSCLAHTHTCMFEQPLQGPVWASHCCVTFTHSVKRTRGPSLPLLFQPHATSNAYSHTGEALCARGRNNCGSSCTVTFNPWQHGKVGALSCQDRSGPVTRFGNG